MNKLKKAYCEGWRALSYFIVLGMLLGMAFGLVNLLTLMGFEGLFGIDPRGKEEGIAYIAYGLIGFIAFLIYAPLIAYYHHRWDGGENHQPKSHNLSESAE